MKLLIIFVITLLTAVTAVAATPSIPQKMRPYVGIGILLVPIKDSAPAVRLPLYEEPALSRKGELNWMKIPAFDWIFGQSPDAQPLIVMARKGTWLRVTYDDAGREAWLNPPRQLPFKTWDQFFKGYVSRLLPGLQKKYYQVYRQPDVSPMAIFSSTQPFKILQLENDWATVLVDQNELGWLRWRDEDGRLLIGIMTDYTVRKP